MYRNLLLILLFLTACGPLRPFHTAAPVISEASLTGCALEEAVQFAAFGQRQLTWYQQRGEVPVVEYRSRLFHGGNGRAVVMVHGFDSSPWPALEIAQFLAGRGFTVIAPLLNGFSSSPTVANGSAVNDYLTSVEEAVSLAKICNSDVSLISHSLGGTLVMDEILNHNLTGVSHHVALSPFFKPSQAVQLLDTTFFPSTPVLSLADLQTFLGGIDPYLFLPLTPPPASAPPLYVPVTAFHGVLTYSAAVLAKAAPPSDVKTLTVVTDDDGVMDVPAALAFVSAEFTRVTKTEYLKAESIGHGLETRKGNPHFDELMQQIATFISGS